MFELNQSGIETKQKVRTEKIIAEIPFELNQSGIETYKEKNFLFQ